MCTWLLGNYRLVGNYHLICDCALGNAQPCPSKGLVFPYIPSMISAWVCNCAAFKSNKEIALKQTGLQLPRRIMPLTVPACPMAFGATSQKEASWPAVITVHPATSISEQE